MNDSQDVNRLFRYAKDSPVISVQQVTVTRSQYLVFSNERAPLRKSFQRFDLLLEAADEPFSVIGTILRDKTPNFLDVSFRRSRDSNVKLCGHV